MLDKSFWSHTSKLQAVSDKLHTLVPSSGSVEKPRKNRALEKYRNATNCYYDLYNNGLCNRSAQFRQVFGIASSHFGSYRFGYSDHLYALVEDKMEEIVLSAAAEQIK